MPVDVLIEPSGDFPDLPGSQDVIHASQIFFQGLEEHAVVNASQKVSREIAKGAVRPVHILKNALGVVGRSDAKIFLVFLIPESWQVIGLTLSLKIAFSIS